jgi:hypothetical protein
LKENFKVWYVGGKAYIDIDDAVEAVLSLVGEREMAIYKSACDDAHVKIFKEARLSLQHMSEGDEEDFMGVFITAGTISFDIGNYPEYSEL